MAVNLSKGAKISLAKAASDSGMAAVPTKLCVGLGWDTNKYVGGFGFAGRVGYGQLDEAAFIQEIFF